MTHTNLNLPWKAVDGEPRRVIKPRSKVACRHCRRRKVRCDVHPHGAPCTNCRLDGLSCTLCERKRRHPNEKLRNIAEQNVQDETERRFLNGSESQISASNASQEIRRSAPSPSQAAIEFQIKEHGTIRSSESDIGISRDVIDVSLQGPFQSPPSATRLLDADTPVSTDLRLMIRESLPAYLRCNLDHLSDEDLLNLKAKECFAIPPKTFLDVLVKHYFDFIHPHLPVIDEEEFWDIYSTQIADKGDFQRDDGSDISFLLFQAMIFSAATCLSLDALQSVGYTSRKNAREVMFSRLHALYSLNFEQDSMANLQSLLLMSYCRGESENGKSAWHWSGLAASLALSLNLHKEPSTELSERQKAIRRRCWWSCVLRDRLVSLSEHSAPRIQLDKCEVPMLTLSDYNVGFRLKTSGLSAEEELGKRTALSIFSLQLIRLALCAPNGPSSAAVCVRGAPLQSSDTWIRSTLASETAMAGIGEQYLDRWQRNLPEVLQHSPSAADDAILPCILLHRIVLNIYYHRAVYAALNTRLLQSTTQDDLERIRDLSHQSSLILADLYGELVDSDLMNCIPRDCIGPPIRSLRTGSGSWRLSKVAKPTSVLASSTNIPAFSAPGVSKHLDDNKHHKTHITSPITHGNCLDGWASVGNNDVTQTLDESGLDHAMGFGLGDVWGIDGIDSFGAPSDLSKDSVESIDIGSSNNNVTTLTPLSDIEVLVNV